MSEFLFIFAPQFYLLLTCGPEPEHPAPWVEEVEVVEGRVEEEGLPGWADTLQSGSVGKPGQDKIFINI